MINNLEYCFSEAIKIIIDVDKLNANELNSLYNILTIENKIRNDTNEKSNKTVLKLKGISFFIGNWEYETIKDWYSIVKEEIHERIKYKPMDYPDIVVNKSLKDIQKIINN